LDWSVFLQCKYSLRITSNSFTVVNDTATQKIVQQNWHHVVIMPSVDVNCLNKCCTPILSKCFLVLFCFGTIKVVWRSKRILYEPLACSMLWVGNGWWVGSDWEKWDVPPLPFLSCIPHVVDPACFLKLLLEIFILLFVTLVEF